MSAVVDLPRTLRSLPDGWNGDGSLAPSHEVIDNCFSLIDLWYPHSADVTPNDNGTVSFEWPGTHLEVGPNQVFDVQRAVLHQRGFPC